MGRRIGTACWQTLHHDLYTGRLLVPGFALLILVLSAGAVHADSDVWTADEPAKAPAERLDAHARSQAALEDRIAESGDLDPSTAEAGSLDGREAIARDPDGSAKADRLDSRIVDSQKLSDLPTSAPENGAIGFDTPNPASWAPTADPRLLAARSNYREALDRTRRAIARYDEMRDENYPRGEPRLKIVRERDRSLIALREAKRALEAAESVR